MTQLRAILACLVILGACPVLTPAVHADGVKGAAARKEPTDEELARALARGEKLPDALLDRVLRLHATDEATVRLVLVPATVEDRRGRRVLGLDRTAFRLYEDHVPQEIRYFSLEEDQPIAIAFLLDVSGSMRQVGKLEAAKEAIRHFVDHLRPGDRFGLICFADDQVTWVTPFTDDRETFLKRLMVQDGYGQTALHDAVARAPELVFDQDLPHKKALVLITDGMDNRSHLTREQALEAARRVRVPIYAIGFSALPEYVLKKGEVAFNLDALEPFTEETGGRLFPVHDPADLKEAVVAIEQELRFQYLIGYYPQRARWDGSFRRIELVTRNPKFHVRARKGYYATP